MHLEILFNTEIIFLLFISQISTDFSPTFYLVIPAHRKYNDALWVNPGIYLWKKNNLQTRGPLHHISLLSNSLTVDSKFSRKLELPIAPIPWLQGLLSFAWETIIRYLWVLSPMDFNKVTTCFTQPRNTTFK